ncbi:hypothetical protein [Streptomyces albogriseolus]
MQKEDPRQIAAARRRVEQGQVRRWALKVEHELRDLERRRASRDEKRYRVPTGFEEREREREVELRSLRDLLRRGLDPAKSRVFNGRALLVVRCKSKGHCLARVYATPYRPIFVPQNADFPAGQTKENRFAHLESSKMLKSYFPEVRLRDTWIEEYPDEALRDELIERERGLPPRPSKERMEEIDIQTTDFAIRGMTVIQPRHGEKEVTWQGVQVQPSWYLTCRCGTRILASYLVVEALQASTQQVFA